MAGTPTTNYNIPTYADTDAPDLSGAYNDAMVIIDTQMKANADAIESASTGNYTGDAPIAVDNGQRKISVATAVPSTGSEPGANGVVLVRGDASQITSDAPATSAEVPNVKAVADYIESKMVAAGAAYTGTAPVVVDNGSHTIRVNGATSVEWSNLDDVPSRRGVVAIFTADWSNIPNGEVFNQIQSYTEDDVQNMDKVALSLSAAESLVYGLKNYVDAATPDATTSVKGLVQLNDTATSTQENTMAMTARGVVSLLNTIKTYNATQKVDVQALAGRLYVDPATGVVFYKAPTD